MMCLTHNPSDGNYNICRHEKAAHKDGSGNSSSPSIVSWFGLRGGGGGGGVAELLGSCGWMGRG